MFNELNYSFVFSLLLTCFVVSIIRVGFAVSASQMELMSSSDFLPSFLARPELLSNSSSLLRGSDKRRRDAKLRKSEGLSVSVYVENWSVHTLLHDRTHIQQFESSNFKMDREFLPHNMACRRREFAFRISSVRPTRSQHGPSGMVGWTLANMRPESESFSSGSTKKIMLSNEKLSRLAVAWTTQTDESCRDSIQLALSLGDVIPNFSSIWEKRDSKNSGFRLTSTSSLPILTEKNKRCGGEDDLSNVNLTKLNDHQTLDSNQDMPRGEEEMHVVELSDALTTVSARLIRKMSFNTLDYVVRLTIVPVNTDVWGWIKYFGRDKHSTTMINGHKICNMRSSSSIENGESRQIVRMRPNGDEIIPVYNTAKVKHTQHNDINSHQIYEKIRPELIRKLKLNRNLPLYDQPSHFLKAGPQLTQLMSQVYGQSFETKSRIFDNLKIRHAFRQNVTDKKIGVGVVIENWSAYDLKFMRPTTVAEATHQDVGQSNRNSLYDVNSGKKEIITITSDETFYEKHYPSIMWSGCAGLLKFKMQHESSSINHSSNVSATAILSIMWSVPSNRHVWQAWSGVAISQESTRKPSFREMYYNDPVQMVSVVRFNQSTNDQRRQQTIKVDEEMNLTSRTSKALFARGKAGVQNQYSDTDSNFLVRFYLDSISSSLKPILKIQLIPIDEKKLASSIRRMLMIPPTSSTIKPVVGDEGGGVSVLSDMESGALKTILKSSSAMSSESYSWSNLMLTLFNLVFVFIILNR